MRKREPHQSQLDFLWQNFGGYFVSTTKEEGSIPTIEVVYELLDSVKSEALSSLEVVGNRLIGRNSSGVQIVNIDISRFGSSSSVVDFGKRLITQEDIEHGYELEVGQPVYFIELSDGTQLLAEAEVDKELILKIKDLELQVAENTNALSIINSEDQPGSLQSILRLAKEYTDSKLATSEDLSELKLQINEIQQDLLILKGSGEGSILNMITTNIESAFSWANY